MQHTIRQSYSFSGKGLHTGVVARMTLRPAPEDNGIRFVRTDIGPDAEIPALASFVGPGERSTTLVSGGASVSTIEHLMSACAGLGIDNLLVEIDGPEVPILDGSALPYVKAIMANGLQDQRAQRRILSLREPYHYEDESGATIDILPSDIPSVDLTVDFNSVVLGVQRCVFSPQPESFTPCRSFAPLLASAGRKPFQASGCTDYATEIAPARTFCFFHELEFLASRGLIKGGDMENAIVIVEHPVEPATLDRMKAYFGVDNLHVRQGYLNNLQLHFPDEIVRHKMLDLIGDFALLGTPLKGTIIASKTGHRANTAVCKTLLESDLLTEDGE